jgi:hypothetical protein
VPLQESKNQTGIRALANRLQQNRFAWLLRLRERGSAGLSMALPAQ